MDGRDPKQHAREEKVRIARLKKARKSIDNEMPKGLRRGKGGKVFRKRDAKKEMKMKAMEEYMKKENQILKRRVADMVKADQKQRSTHIKFRSVNAVVQAKEQRRIKNDNDILKRNLANSTAFYDVAAIERDTARMKKQWKRNPFTILRENNAKRLVKENKELPDLIMIDGGKGQVNIVKAELLKLNLESIKIIGVSKGSSRIPGNEKIIIEEAKIIKKLRKDSMASHLIQNIRDEAHRFAISAHRNKINKKTFASPLDDISGLGPKRKQNLLKFFGGIQSLQKASSEEISKVPGISQKLANSVFLYLNGNKI